MEETMLMEADSTSGGGGGGGAGAPAHSVATEVLAKQRRNIEFYDKHILENSLAGGEEELAQWLQTQGLLPRGVSCASGGPACRMHLRRNSRAGDKVSWLCEACGRRKPLRTRSFFQNINCSIPDILKILLAWSEDLGHEAVAKCLDVKETVALAVYERVEACVSALVTRTRLGGVVLADMYPACLPHRSPDSTHQHHHTILMLADTSSVPTRYYLHVMSDNTKAIDAKSSNKCTVSNEVSGVLTRVCERGSTLVVGAGLPAVRPSSFARVLSLHTLTQNADPGMAHFLQERLWRQATVLCQASRDVCGEAVAGAGVGDGRCGGAVQRYLHVALHRLRHDADGFYQHVLALVARHYTHTPLSQPKHNT